MKLYVVQMKILPGNVSANMQTMKAAFDRAKAAEVDCVVFPRNALTGPSNKALPVDWAEIRKYAAFKQGSPCRLGRNPQVCGQHAVLLVR